MPKPTPSSGEEIRFQFEEWLHDRGEQEKAMAVQDRVVSSRLAEYLASHGPVDLEGAQEACNFSRDAILAIINTQALDRLLAEIESDTTGRNKNRWEIRESYQSALQEQITEMDALRIMFPDPDFDDSLRLQIICKVRQFHQQSAEILSVGKQQFETLINSAGHSFIGVCTTRSDNIYGDYVDSQCRFGISNIEFPDNAYNTPIYENTVFCALDLHAGERYESARYFLGRNALCTRDNNQVWQYTIFGQPVTADHFRDFTRFIYGHPRRNTEERFPVNVYQISAQERANRERANRYQF